MKYIFTFMGILTLLTSCFVGKSKKVENAEQVKPNASVYDLSIQALDGTTKLNLSDYKGKYLVVSFTERVETIRIISARLMTREELYAYEQ